MTEPHCLRCISDEIIYHSESCPEFDQMQFWALSEAPQRPSGLRLGADARSHLASLMHAADALEELDA